MEGKDKKRKIISLICIMLFLVLIFAATYAFFGTYTQNLNNQVNVNITIDELNNSTFVSENANLSLTVPASKMGAYLGNIVAAENNTLFNVTLTSGSESILMTCNYDIYFVYDSSSSVYGQDPTPVSGGGGQGIIELALAINMSDFSSNGSNDYEEDYKNFNYDTSDGWIPATGSDGPKRKIVGDATISDASEIGTTQSWLFDMHFNNIGLDQNALAGKTFSGHFYVDNVNCNNSVLETDNVTNAAKTLILSNNGGQVAIRAKGTPDFSQAATTNEGMYAANDDDGISYYFRGAVDNNWLKFGQENGEDIYWRIVRIDGMGGLRLIYAGLNAPTLATSVKGDGSGYITTGNDQSGYIKYSINNNRAEYVGFAYSLNVQHCNNDCTNNSYIFDSIGQGWLAYVDISESGSVYGYFCNDRTSYTSLDASVPITGGASYGTMTPQYFGASIRVNNNAPSLMCPDQDDLLQYHVGETAFLLTVDEAMMAGITDGNSANTYLGGTDYFWLFSPAIYDGSAYVYCIDDTEVLDNCIVNSSDVLVRPVILIYPDFIQGNLVGSGTWDDPYEFEILTR